jgi:hypothetical protein
MILVQNPDVPDVPDVRFLLKLCPWVCIVEFALTRFCSIVWERKREREREKERESGEERACKRKRESKRKWRAIMNSKFDFTRIKRLQMRENVFSEIGNRQNNIWENWLFQNCSNLQVGLSFICHLCHFLLSGASDIQPLKVVWGLYEHSVCKKAPNCISFQRVTAAGETSARKRTQKWPQNMCDMQDR